jgi:hypothetical protein
MDRIEEIEIVNGFLIEAAEYGLQSEVVTYALQAMKDDPELSIVSAMSNGFYEWVK